MSSSVRTDTTALVPISMCGAVCRVVDSGTRTLQWPVCHMGEAYTMCRCSVMLPLSLNAVAELSA